MPRLCRRVISLPLIGFTLPETTEEILPCSSKRHSRKFPSKKPQPPRALPLLNRFSIMPVKLTIE
jgi:hypothetical protein